MRKALVLLAILAALIAASQAGAAIEQQGRPCNAMEKQAARNSFPGERLNCWTNGNVYVISRARGACVGAFVIFPLGEVVRAWYDLRLWPGGRQVDFEMLTFEEAYVKCGLVRGRYYKMQVSASWYDEDYNKDFYESPWIRFKVPLR